MRSSNVRADLSHLALERGKSLNFHNLRPEEVQELYRRYSEVNPESLNWDIRYTCTEKGRGCVTQAARVDGCSLAELAGIDAVPGGNIRRFVIEREGLPDVSGKRRPRATKIGWEDMKIGDTTTVRLHAFDLKFFGQAFLRRRQLHWAFEAQRMEDVGGSGVPVWLVRRIR